MSQKIAVIAIGGNSLVKDKAHQSIEDQYQAVNETCRHIADMTEEGWTVAIGHGSPIQKDEEEEFFDWHGGVDETSIMLYLKPELVKMERAQKPEIHFTSKMSELRMLAQENPDLMVVWESLFGVPVETKKGGASHELSSNGVWSFSDPKKATKERGEKSVGRMVDQAVKFIETWKKAKN